MEGAVANIFSLWVDSMFIRNNFPELFKHTHTNTNETNRLMTVESESIEPSTYGSQIQKMRNRFKTADLYGRGTRQPLDTGIGSQPSVHRNAKRTRKNCKYLGSDLVTALAGL